MSFFEKAKSYFRKLESFFEKIESFFEEAESFFEAAESFFNGNNENYKNISMPLMRACQKFQFYQLDMKRTITSTLFTFLAGLSTAGVV